MNTATLTQVDNTVEVLEVVAIRTRSRNCFS